MESMESSLSKSGGGMESGVAPANVVFVFPSIPNGLALPSIIVLENGEERFIESSKCKENRL